MSVLGGFNCINNVLLRKSGRWNKSAERTGKGIGVPGGAETVYKSAPHVKWLKCEMQPGGPTLKKGESFSNPAGRIFYNFNQKIEMIL